MQIPLFDLPSPLDQTVGKAFFTELPKAPGVYRMYGDRDELLYVGKAKNLRSRLMSYRRVKIGHSSSKSLRLVHSVSKIEIEESPTEEQALLRENEILRVYKPPFNVVNTQPEKYFYFVIQVPNEIERDRPTEASIQFSLTSEIEGAIFGAYKGLSLCHRTFFALRRVLWAFRQLPNDEEFRYPLDLFRKQKLTPHTFITSKEDLNLLAGFLHGFKGSPTETEAAFVTRAQQHLARFRCDLFHRNWFEEDLKTLSKFFKQGPLRNQNLKLHSKQDSPLVGQSQVDDLMVRQRFHLLKQS